MTWLHPTAPRPRAAARLVCFPHAGGTAASYARWGAGLPGVDVHAVCYPGRAERSLEPCATDPHDLARRIAAALRPLADRPLALFGHSMGAWLAYETARLLERDGVPVSHLFASAAGAPQHRRAPDVRLTHGDDAAIADLVSRLGGTGQDEAVDPGVLVRVFPYVIADLRMAGRYVHRPGPPLGCDITTVVADADPAVPPDAATGWAELTRGACRGHIVPGHHFYLTTHPPFALVEAALATAVRA